METIRSEDVKEGMRFSAPVFFDDGKNMFLAEAHNALSRKRPFALVDSVCRNIR